MTDGIGWGVPITLGGQRVLREGRFRWLRAVAWMVALVFVIAMAFGPTMEAVRDLLPKNDPRLGLLTRCAGAAIALGAYALLVRLGEARKPEEIALRPALGQLFVGLLIGCALFGFVMAAMVLLGLYEVGFVGFAPAWRPLGLAIEASVVEELMIRGVILRLLWRAFGPLAAFIISAALFGAGHLPNPGATWFAAICVALEAGIMLGAFYALTGRLWVSIGVHMAWNFTQGYLFGAAVSGGDVGPSIARSTAHPDMPEWLTGGAFGPEASLPALIVCTAAGAATLWLAWKAGRFNGLDPVDTDHTQRVQFKLGDQPSARVALAYTIDSEWRNRDVFLTGRKAIVTLLTEKWSREEEYRLVKDLWAFTNNRIAVRFQYECRVAGQWLRCFGNEQWEFATNGLMRRREASVNDVAISEEGRRFRWNLGMRPDTHSGLIGAGS